VNARITADGRVSLPAELRKKHGLLQGGEVIVEDADDAIVPRTVDQVVARGQALSRSWWLARSTHPRRSSARGEGRLMSVALHASALLAMLLENRASRVKAELDGALLCAVNLRKSSATTLNLAPYDRILNSSMYAWQSLSV
jgi:bifunctional DNA-binding transcriptional regulator/antitoxin component of YhaV-PrlF toxin-antitoxin module